MTSSGARKFNEVDCYRVPVTLHRGRGIVVLLVGAVLTATGVAFSLLAIASPSWEVVLMTEFQSEHEHGLWLDCARTVKSGISKGELYTYFGERHCTYKFDFMDNPQIHPNDILDKNTPDAENQTHTEFKAFHIAYLILIGAAILGGISNMLITLCACRDSYCALIIFTIFSLMGAANSFVVVVSYFFLSHTVDNRWVKGVTAIYDTSLGDAYYFEQYAILSFLLAFMIGMLLLKCFGRTKSRAAVQTTFNPRRNAQEKDTILPLQPYPRHSLTSELQVPSFFPKSASRRGSAFESRVSEPETASRITTSAIVDDSQKLLSAETVV
uniref:Clc-like protein n=1 Tax=Plectus sambesii TaxID=2011161 RepID=A0A914VU30_9BILA